MSPAGYSGTPLAKKLGIKPEQALVALHPPAGYRELLAPLPPGVTISEQLSPGAVFIHLFADRRATLDAAWPAVKEALAKTGMVWVSWPKKASGVATDVDEAYVRRSGLRIGLVDVKICAVDQTWSGLKFVYRLKDR